MFRTAVLFSVNPTVILWLAFSTLASAFDWKGVAANAAHSAPYVVGDVIRSTQENTTRRREIEANERIQGGWQRVEERRIDTELARERGWQQVQRDQIEANRDIQNTRTASDVHRDAVNSGRTATVTASNGQVSSAMPAVMSANEKWRRENGCPEDPRKPCSTTK